MPRLRVDQRCGHLKAVRRCAHAAGEDEIHVELSRQPSRIDGATVAERRLRAEDEQIAEAGQTRDDLPREALAQTGLCALATVIFERRNADSSDHISPTAETREPSASAPTRATPSSTARAEGGSGRRNQRRAGPGETGGGSGATGATPAC